MHLTTRHQESYPPPNSVPCAWYKIWPTEPDEDFSSDDPVPLKTIVHHFIVLATVINKVQRRYLMRIHPPRCPLRMSIQVQDFKVRLGITSGLRVAYLT